MASPNQPHFLDENKTGHSTSAEQYALLPLPSSSPDPKQSGAPSYQEPVSQKSAFSRRFLSPRTIIPTLVLVVHTFLLIFSWSFFAITISKPRALPVPLAIRVGDHFQSAVMVTTLFASSLALVSSALYTRAIRYSLARFLANRVSLFGIASAVRLSQQSLIRNFKQPLWTIAAALCLIALNAQTAGWTTLLTPKMIEINSPITGYELDLKSPAFQNLLAASKLSVNTDAFSRVIAVTEASGSTAVGTRFDLPSILNFNHFSYTNSTMGIMPVSTQVIDSKITSITGTTLPIRVDIHKMVETPPGFPVRFVLTQQGFTAQVSCQQRSLDTTTQPSLALHSANDLLFGSVATLAQLEVRCAGATNSTFSAPVLTSSNVDAVFGVSCPVNQSGEKERWDLILTGSGIYKPINTTVCSVFPEVNMVNVNYGDNTKLFNSSFPNFINSSQPWGGQDAPWLGNFGLSVFLQGLKVGQSTSGNSMGDTVLSFLANVPSGSGVLEEVLAQYVRGVVEVGVTILRTAYTENNNGLYPGGSSVIPTSMRSTINGTYWAETIGWNQATETAGGVLVAPTFVSLTAILIIVVTLMMKKGEDEPEVNRYFDPGDLIHLISAASAGGLSMVNFPAYDEKTVNYSDSITVTLAPVGGPGTKSGFISHKA